MGVSHYVPISFLGNAVPMALGRAPPGLHTCAHCPVKTCHFDSLRHGKIAEGQDIECHWFSPQKQLKWIRFCFVVEHPRGPKVIFGQFYTVLHD